MKIDPIINVGRIDEALLIGMFDRGGLASNRIKLSDDNFEILRNLFKHPLVRDEVWLKTYLNLLFGNFFLTRQRERTLRERDDPTATVKSVRDEVKDLTNRFSGVSVEQIDELRGDIQKQVGLLSTPATSILDFLRPKNSYPRSWKIRSGELEDGDYLRFIAHSRSVSDALNQYVKRGSRGEPVLKQMCRALGFLYFDATGEIPRRSISSPGGSPTDRGPLLELARTFERLINDGLPEELRQKAPTSMTNMCREISDEIAKEVDQTGR